MSRNGAETRHASVGNSQLVMEIKPGRNLDPKLLAANVLALDLAAKKRVHRAHPFRYKQILLFTRKKLVGFYAHHEVKTPRPATALTGLPGIFYLYNLAILYARSYFHRHFPYFRNSTIALAENALFVGRLTPSLAIATGFYLRDVAKECSLVYPHLTSPLANVAGLQAPFFFLTETGTRLANRVSLVGNFSFYSVKRLLERDIGNHLDIRPLSIFLPATSAELLEYAFEYIAQVSDVIERTGPAKTIGTESALRREPAPVHTTKTLTTKPRVRTAKAIVPRSLFSIREHLVRLVYLLKPGFVSMGFIGMVLVRKTPVRFFYLVLRGGFGNA